MEVFNRGYTELFEDHKATPTKVGSEACDAENWTQSLTCKACVLLLESHTCHGFWNLHHEQVEEHWKIVTMRFLTPHIFIASSFCPVHNRLNQIYFSIQMLVVWGVDILFLTVIAPLPPTSNSYVPLSSSINFAVFFLFTIALTIPVLHICPK